MQSLVIDTSNQYLVVAYYKDGVLVEGFEAYGKQRQSEYAIPKIDELLTRHHAELLEMDELIVTKGPGSYTGVRVGLTIAKVVKVANPNVNVKMVSSLQAYAGTEGKKVAVLDARSHKVFVCSYLDGQPLEEEHMVDIDDFSHYMASHADFEVVGDTALVAYPQTTVSLSQQLFELSKTIQPTADVHQLLPTYIKNVEAKQLWQPSDH